jgi:hypothetical protein
VKKKLVKPKKIQKAEKVIELNSPKTQEDHQDFGGLPKIDFKKNLGCG